LLNFAAGVTANVAIAWMNFVIDVWIGIQTTEGGILLLILTLKKWCFGIGFAVTDSEACFQHYR
ncbi:12414_t:CDS:1, partial [Gigaspora margarita]